jgi:FkbM family methyltransferase
MVRAALAATPTATREAFLCAAAVAPPRCKTSSFQRFCAAVASCSSVSDRLVQTNLGISSRLRCSMPLRKIGYVFGQPENHVAERGTYDLATELAKDCRHFVDIGANEGIFVFLVFHRSGGRIQIHWFEPDPLLGERLDHNVSVNSLSVSGNRGAVGETCGRARFFRNLTDDSAGSLELDLTSRHSIVEDSVDLISLNAYFERELITQAIVKIDVEGAASRVWQGMDRCTTAVSYLIIEMLTPEIRIELPGRIISETGWHAYYIRDFDLIESRNGEFEYEKPYWNWLFCRFDAAALALRLAATRFNVVPARRDH